uniref:hypothetical protein n=1 Tax=uncultured Bacteroides sp. TaxID=162156 RepID=UPI0025F07A1A|nr:hypothetical protein [uncultured Bacteroides sp.]
MREAKKKINDAFRRYFSPLCLYAMRCFRNMNLVEDISNAKTYLNVMVGNHCCDTLKKDKLGGLKLVLKVLFVITLFSACEKEGISNSEVPSYPEKTDKGRFDEIPFAWDYRSTSVSEDDLFIGDLYISVDNRYMVTPPPLYLGAAYNENDFGIFFKPEIIAPRNSLDVIFDFTKPFTGTIDNESGSIGYKKLLADALMSKQYKEYINDKHSPFDIRMVEVYTYDDIEKAFPCNSGSLGKLLSKEVQSTSKIKDVKSRLTGFLANRSFTANMDIPIDGFFKDKNMNTSPENPVYIRSITYGKTAFFVIESPYSYKEVEDVILSKLSLKDSVDKEEEILKKSSITLFVVSDNLQTAKVFTDFGDFDKFLESPFNEHLYGYPIYCQGVYTKDNTVFGVK